MGVALGVFMDGYDCFKLVDGIISESAIGLRLKFIGQFNCHETSEESITSFRQNLRGDQATSLGPQMY